MLECKIDQGTIIYGIRSEKYPAKPCYGIIITARCDIAQKKVPKYYYLVAVDASEWFCSKHGFSQVYSEKIKQTKKKVCETAFGLKLDGDALLNLSEDKCKIILEDKQSQIKGNKDLEKKIKALRQNIEKYYQMAQEDADDASRGLIIKDNSKDAIQYLKDIDSGKRHHYYFLPQNAYLINGTKGKGLIVDMLEIGTLSLSDAHKIVSPFDSGINFENLPKLPAMEDLVDVKEESFINKVLPQISEYIRLTTLFWLNEKSDFVGIDGTISSPWCEHLMQRFSNVFIRIGLDNPTEHDFQNVIEACYGKEKQ